MLNENTRSVLKSLGGIGNSAIIRYPLTSVLQLDKSLVAFVDLEALGENEFDEFGLYYMSEFLGLLDFYSNADIQINNGIVDIKSAGSNQKYQTTDLDTMELFDIPSKVLDRIDGAQPIAEFELSKDDIDRFKKISTLAKVNSLVFESNASNISAIICDVDASGNYMNASTNMLDVSNVSEPIKIQLEMSNISKLPSYNFKVKVIKNNETGNFISLWVAEEQPVKIIVAVTKSLI